MPMSVTNNNNEWIGEMPFGVLGHAVRAGDAGWCGAGACGLARISKRPEFSFRTRQGRGGERIESDEAEGEFRLHLWLKYEGYS